MDEKVSALDIVRSYDEISIEDSDVLSESLFFFRLCGNRFLFFAPDENDPSSCPGIYLYNDELLNAPHIMLNQEEYAGDEQLPKGIYRWICLYEQNSVVWSLMGHEEKIYDAINRLIELLSMTEKEREYEFQKEFLYYWNSASKQKGKYSIYLQRDDEFTNLSLYYGEKEIRIIGDNLILTDINKLDKKNEREWIRHTELEAYFIPIIDSRGIIPPHRGYQWTQSDIRNIVYGKQVAHISDETFNQLKNITPKYQDILLVFGMKTEQTDIVFASKLKCKSGSHRPLLDKICNDVISVEPWRVSRKDYLYLSKQIGNDLSLTDSRTLLVGAGSLGSYAAFELVKNGTKHLTIYDGDKLEDENVLRWIYGGIGRGTGKASTISILLQLLHPEIVIDAHDTNLSNESLEQVALQNDMIIFTIGSTDQQLKFNKQLMQQKCSVPVLFVWIEEGGTNSHILYVNYQSKGCYECLYTDENGKRVNNRARRNTQELSVNGVVQNGCGGTRAAYGTAVLLRTTAALLEVISKIKSGHICESTLWDITPERVIASDLQIRMKGCDCCGL